jgi:ApaG protein
MSEIDNAQIDIDVVTDYISEQSDPTVDRYVFAYTITINNCGAIPAKLLNRHWLITDANGKFKKYAAKA